MTAAVAIFTTRARYRPARGLTAGFSLLEVLVAIVVLSFGVLGVVGLQAATLQANKEARYQSSAVRLGRELADLMRGNKYVATSAGSPYVGDFSAIPNESGVPDCSMTLCNSSTTAGQTSIAKFEMAEWMRRVRNELPNARVEVCQDATPYVSATGLPQWACSGTGGMYVLKMGWTRQAFNRSAGTLDLASTPAVVLPLLPGP